MDIETVKLVFFSPTGTTRSVVQGIAEGFGAGSTELVDITKAEARKHPLRASENELLVIGVPVYMGRVPALLNDWLESMEADNTPAVCVVVYGNRVYDNALLELKDAVVKRGCVPVGGGAYIGEHSFSSPELPTAEGRPDSDDLAHAREFGVKVRAKLDAISSISGIPDAAVPGERPYGGVTTLWDVDFIEVSEECVQCGICAEVCPMDAVDSQDSRMIDQVKCITCCACIKQCPQDARSIKPGPVKEAQKRLNNLFHERREPEYFV